MVVNSCESLFLQCTFEVLLQIACQVLNVPVILWVFLCREFFLITSVSYHFDLMRNKSATFAYEFVFIYVCFAPVNGLGADPMTLIYRLELSSLKMCLDTKSF